MGNSKEGDNGLKQILYFKNKTDTMSGFRLSNVTCSWHLTKGVLSHANPTQYINNHVFKSRNDIRMKENVCNDSCLFSLITFPRCITSPHPSNRCLYYDSGVLVLTELFRELLFSQCVIVHLLSISNLSHPWVSMH